MDFTNIHAKYIFDLERLLEAIDSSTLDTVAAQIMSAKNVFCAGNGGSNANASHFVLHLRESGLSAWDLLADNPTLSALSNDRAYERALSQQLRLRGATSDALVIFSGSGDSPNIIMALAEARRIGMPTIGFLGFQGGMARGLCDLAIICDSAEYGPVEDTHSAAIHIVKYIIADARESHIPVATRNAGNLHEGPPADTSNAGTDGHLIQRPPFVGARADSPPACAPKNGGVSRTSRRSQ